MLQFKTFLQSTGCAIALLAGVAGSAQAQLSGLLNVGTTGITGGGGFGLNGKAWIPFLGVAGAYLEGGFQDHDPFVDVGFGSRFMLGNNLGIGGLLTFSTQRGHDSHDQFYSIKPTVEVGLGNLTLGATFNIPVGSKEHTVKNSGSAQGQLRNKPGTTTCTNPTSTDNKVCDLWLVGRENSVEQNRFGVDLNAQYELSLGGFSITPQVGLYVYDRQGKNLVGVHGGVDVGFNVGYGLTVDVSAGIRHDNKNHNYDSDHRTQGVFTGGLTWHFGGNSATTSTRFVDRAPLRTVYDRGIRSHQQLGNSFEERARLQDNTSNVAVAAVRFVDSSNEGMAISKINGMAANTLVIVNGTVNLPNASIAFGNDHVAVVGGGASVQLLGATTGRAGIFHVPGAAGRLVQKSTADIFQIFNNRQNIILQGLQLDGTGKARAAIFANNNADELRVRDMTINNLTDVGIIISNTSDNAILSNLTFTNTGKFSGIAIESGSTKASLEHIRLQNTGTDGISVNSANGTTLQDIHIDTAGDDGIDITDSANVTVTGADIRNVANDGIEVFGIPSQTITLQDVQVHNSQGHGIHIISGPDNITLRNILVVGNNIAMRRGINIQPGSLNISLENVQAVNWQVGFGIFGTIATPTSVIDKGGNRFTSGAVGQTACDGSPDATGSLQVQVTGGGLVTCN